mmetsp:Transcript_18737/g.29539  ORF Transcript_18737/g.29539 Transcript_18737/m.29539 type:complete len:114 (-) Transcript_18737:7-348(-)
MLERVFNVYCDRLEVPVFHVLRLHCLHSDHHSFRRHLVAMIVDPLIVGACSECQLELKYLQVCLRRSPQQLTVRMFLSQLSYFCCNDTRIGCMAEIEHSGYRTPEFLISHIRR